MHETEFNVRLPKNIQYDAAGEEYFYLTQNGQERKIMLQDYKELYGMPRFYEYFVLKYLNYQSPEVLSKMLAKQLQQANQPASELKVLDIGAGSGLMGKQLKTLGVSSVVGMDIIPQAAEATQRDYPNIYENYYVEDLTQIREETAKALEKKGFNCLVCCSALSHIPVSAFARAYKMIDTGGWIVFNVFKDIWEDKGPEGFTKRHSWVDDPAIFELKTQYAYLHRNRTNGSPIDYIAFVGVKRGYI